MRSITDDFLASLKARFAECPMISLTLETVTGGLRLIGAFETHTDGIIRRYDFHLPASPLDDPDGQLRKLIAALAQFEHSIEAVTRTKNSRIRVIEGDKRQRC